MIPTFRLRIALLSAAVSGVVLIAFGAVAGLWLAHEKTEAMDREIKALAYRHPGWMNNQAQFERLGSAIEFIFGSSGLDRFVLAALDTNGTVRFRSAGWPSEIDPSTFDLRLEPNSVAHSPLRREPTPAPSATPTAAPADAPSAASVDEVDEPDRRGRGFGPGGGFGRGGGRARGGTVAEDLFTRQPRFFDLHTTTNRWRMGVLGNDRSRLVVGLDRAESDTEIRRMRNAFAAALPAALGLIGVGGWLVAGRAVRPLRRIAETAERITARGLDQRMPSSAEDPEIQRLVGVLNRMMDRLETSFRQATRFAADASHELKTPLAVMQGELEQALQKVAEGSLDQKTYATLLEQTQRLKTITRGLLLLAQADSGRMPLSPTRWDLSSELSDMLDDARVAADEANLRLEADVAPDVAVVADRVLLRLAFSNLLANAIQYSETGGRVRVVLRRTGEHIVLEVGNTGPGIAPEDRDKVFDRFYRGAGARERRHEGMGLGASLAREIVVAHRGELTLVRSVPGDTLFRLSLPSPREASFPPEEPHPGELRRGAV